MGRNKFLFAAVAALSLALTPGLAMLALAVEVPWAAAEA